MNYKYNLGQVVVCLHVLEGFKPEPDENHVLCQLDTDQGKMNLASCRGCLEKLLQGAPDAWDGYRTLSKPQAETLGIRIAGSGMASAGSN
jgi:hypothetical protein